MPYILKGDLTTHLYPEIIETITRESDDIVNECVKIAIDEAKSYLMRFDLKALFGFIDGDSETEATVIDYNLKSKIKDLTCWHLIKLSNPNIDVAMFRTSYEDAIKWLDNIKKSQLSPDGWPYKVDESSTLMNEGAMVFGSSNTKRRNHW